MRITDDLIKSICSQAIYKRGTEYFREGRVHIKSMDENTIRAVVDGAQIYNVSISMKDGKITQYFCTCPYYHTMGCSCKHIVAALKTCMKNDRNGMTNDNDRLAAALCDEYKKLDSEKKKVNVSFCLNIYTGVDKCSCSVGIKAGIEKTEPIEKVGAFIKGIYGEGKVILSKHKRPDADECVFGADEKEILDILHEVGTGAGEGNAEMYVGDYTLKHILPILERVECEFKIDGVSAPDLRIIEDDPDILLDVNAEKNSVNMIVTERANALTADGSWFLYEGMLYKTTKDWQSWFMPVYKTVIAAGRTQVDFEDSNAVGFVVNVLPRIRGKRGVVLNGFEEMVIDQKPRFEIFADKYNDSVTAAVLVHYGAITINLSQESGIRDKILVRNTRLEKEVVGFFSDFENDGTKFVSDDNDVIFDFLTRRLAKLETYADVIYNNKINIEKAPIKAKVGYRGDINLLEVGFESELSDAEISAIIAAVKLKKPYYRAKNGIFYELETDGISPFSMIESLGFDEKDIAAGKKSVSTFNSFYLSGLEGAGIIEGDKSFDKFVNEIKNVKVNIPKEIDSVLRDYQREGVKWLAQLAAFGFGGILADDMGLGKTLQVIAFSMSVSRDKPVLVVTPSSLTYNWQSEIAKFAPSAKSVIIEGVKEDRVRLTEDLDGYDFVITSYPLMRRDMELYRKKEFAYFFIDEAQYIKNPGTINAKSVKKIKAGGYFALTGTPIENSLSELWSIFDFVMNGYLYSYREFVKRFESGIMKNEDKAAIDELREKIRPFILRRMKKEVLKELPEKIENTVYAGLEREQKKMYEAFLKSARNEVMYMDNLGGEGRMRILAHLMRLRQICCHPRLFDSNFKDESGKLLLFEELASSAVGAGHRILVFSQFTSMLSIIAESLDKLGISYFYLDGSTPPEERIELASRFNKGEKDVFLISLKAGGTGLNLTGADMVIHYDPWWNPAVMDQASDRAYRIGQDKAVQVIKLAAKGTIEEQIIKLQDKKKELANDLIKENSRLLSGLTKEEILAIFS